MQHYFDEYGKSYHQSKPHRAKRIRSDHAQPRQIQT